MGTDMHYMIEYRKHNEPHWWVEVEQAVKAPRNYVLFANLAGVRNSWGIVPVAAGRGLPSDRTFVSYNEWQIWVPDGHHVSWIDGDEYAKRILGIDEIWDQVISSAYVKAGQKHCPDEGHLLKYRIVFWFDDK